MASDSGVHPAITVRPATEADIPRILEIERESEGAGHFAEADYQQAMASNPNANTAQARRIVLIAEAAGVACGFLVARFLYEEWEIENIAVAKPARRAGFGESLVSAFLQSHACSKSGLERAQAPVKSVFLEVRESNLAARNLYEKSGFAIAGRRQAYRNPEENAILYRYSFQ